MGCGASSGVSGNPEQAPLVPPSDARNPYGQAKSPAERTSFGNQSDQGQQVTDHGSITITNAYDLTSSLNEERESAQDDQKQPRPESHEESSQDIESLHGKHQVHQRDFSDHVDKSDVQAQSSNISVKDSQQPSSSSNSRSNEEKELPQGNEKTGGEDRASASIDAPDTVEKVEQTRVQVSDENDSLLPKRQTDGERDTNRDSEGAASERPQAGPRKHPSSGGPRASLPKLHDDGQSSSHPNLESVKKSLIFGNVDVECPPTAKLVRIFLSSTFTDTKQERNHLLERSYPRLKATCKQRGYEFQLVDMRWGVGQGITNDHKTSDTCYKEIRLCQKLSTGPNFVTLLSHKYGYYAYPHRLNASTFEQLLSGVQSDDEMNMLRKWFVKDDNAVPSEYVMHSISHFHPDFLSPDFEVFNRSRRLWNKDCDKLVDILYEAARKSLGEEEADIFMKGVTHTEIDEGILLNAKRADVCLWIRREIKNFDPNYPQAYRFADTLEETDAGKRRCRLLEDLKEQLNTSLPKQNIHPLIVEWSPNEIDPIGNADHARYIDDLCSEFETRVEDMFTKAADDREAQCLGDPLLEELAHHTAIANSRCQDFHGREELMRKIKNDYLLNPARNKLLLLHGTSGSGKTSVIAMTMKEAWDWMDKRVAIVTRFIGSSPDSSHVRDVLTSMTRQIHKIYGDQTEDNTILSFNETCQRFTRCLDLAAKGLPLILLLDSFEQLDPIEEAMNLSWIPNPLPPKVKIIVSVLEDEAMLNKLKELVTPIEFKLEGLSHEDAMSTLNLWLSEENRTLTSAQFEKVHQAFQRCSIPLYIRLSLQETLRWRSSFQDEDTVLQDTVEEAIKAFFKRIENQHGRIFTSHVLGYLTLAIRGLTESELEDILSCDDDVLGEVFSFWVPPIRRLPPLLLVRLRNDLDLYIAQREIDNAVTLMWYHQLFKQVAGNIYCNQDTTLVPKLHENIADFFSGRWAGCKKPFTDKRGQVQEEDRQVPHQPLRNGTEVNLRKLSNLPWHLAHLGNSQRLKEECLFNIEFMMLKMKAMGVRSVVNDFTDAMGCFKQEKAMFKLIKQAILISQKAILRDVSELPTQLLNRLQQKVKGFNDLKTLLQNCRKVTFPILLCDQNVLTPPGTSLQYSVPCHKGRVVYLDLTSDGTKAVTCGLDHKTVTWNIDTGNPIWSCDVGDEEPIKALFASDDAAVVVVTNQSVSTYGTDTGKQFKRLSYQELHVESPAVCVAGKSKRTLQKSYVLMFTSDAVWKFGSKKLGNDDNNPYKIPKLLHGRIGKESIFSESGDVVAVTDEERYYILIFKVKTLSYIASRRIYPAFNVPDSSNEIGPKIDAMCFSKSGNDLFVSNLRKTDIICLNAKDLEETARMEGNENDRPSEFRVTCDTGMVYFPSETHVVLRKTDLQHPERACVAEHKCHVTFTAMSNSGTLVTVGDDNNLRLWKYNPSKIAWPVGTALEDEPPNMIRTLCLFPTNPRYVAAVRVATDRSRYLLVQDLADNKLVRYAPFDGNLELEVYKDDPNNLSAIVRPSTSGKLCVLDLYQMRVTENLGLETYEAESGERSFKVLRKRDEVVCIPTSQEVLYIYNLITRDKSKIDCERGQITNFAVNQREITLAVATELGFLTIYDLENKRSVRRLEPEVLCPECPECCEYMTVTCVSPDSKHAAKYTVLHLDPMLKVWDIDKNKEAQRLQIYRPDAADDDGEFEVTEAMYLPGQKLLVAFQNGKTQVFDLATGLMQSNNKFHGPEVRLSSSDGEAYLTYGEDVQDQTIAVWSSVKPKPVVTFTCDQKVDQATLSRDGHVVIGCLRDPAKIVTWHVQDGKVSRDSSLRGQQLFSDSKVIGKIVFDTDTGDDGCETAGEDLDGEDEQSETL